MTDPDCWHGGILHREIEAALRKATEACKSAADGAVTNVELSQWCEGAIGALREASLLAQAQAWIPKARTAPAAEIAELYDYPWVVWNVTVKDPDRIAGADVGERTAAAATAAAELYGCVYEYCVDDDELPDGTKYYSWLVGVSQAEHRRRVGNAPVVIAEIVGCLLTTLPPELNLDERWTVASVIRCKWSFGASGFGG